MTSDLKKKMYLSHFIEETYTQVGHALSPGLRASSQQGRDEAEVSVAIACPWTLGCASVPDRRARWGRVGTCSSRSKVAVIRSGSLGCGASGMVCSQRRSVYQQSLVHPSCGDSLSPPGYTGQGDTWLLIGHASALPHLWGWATQSHAELTGWQLAWMGLSPNHPPRLLKYPF